MSREIPWSQIVVQSIAVFVLIAALQYVFRGEITLETAGFAAIGYLGVLVAIEWYQLRSESSDTEDLEWEDEE